MNEVVSPARYEVSILVVGYNSRAHLGDALGSIASSVAGRRCEVLFVNNGTDNSEEFVQDRFPEVRILASNGNVGFGAANNNLARSSQGHFLLLLNPDTRLEPGAVDRLLSVAEAHPEFGIAGGLSTNQNGDALAMSRLVFPSLPSLLRGLLVRGGHPVPQGTGQIVEVDAVSGGFLLIRRDVWDALAGFDERFFLYAEELDLCRRWHDLGGKVGLVPAARLAHDVGSGDPGSPSRQLFLMRGNATFYRKHLGPLHAGACLLIHWLSCASRWAIGSLLSPFNPRFAANARSMRDVALRPWRWWMGYA